MTKEGKTLGGPFQPGEGWNKVVLGEPGRGMSFGLPLETIPAGAQNPTGDPVRHVASESDVLIKHQEELEEFLGRATPQEIREQMAYLHGCLVENVASLPCGKWDGDMISDCAVCHTFAFAWATMIHAGALVPVRV